eukprot:1140892-Pelagomonas_calceolata.AAC.5
MSFGGPVRHQTHYLQAKPPLHLLHSHSLLPPTAAEPCAAAPVVACYPLHSHAAAAGLNEAVAGRRRQWVS